LGRYLLLCSLLAAGVWAVYGQTTGFDYIGYDDRLYVVENSQVRKGLSRESIAWAWTSRQESNWFPLTRLSHLLDVEMFGLHPGGHHATNALLHVFNVLLLFAVLQSMTGATARSAFVAALFAIHPLQVESVAWISERKTLLCTAFGLLAFGAYAAWTRNGGIARYLSSLALFAFSLMSKPMFVTLPFVLLLLDYWPLDRRGRSRTRLVLEKLPFFALTAVSSTFTWAIQGAGGATLPDTVLPFPLRLANAVYAYASYLRKTFWPEDLGLFYPHPFLAELGGAPLTPLQVAAAAALLLAISAVALASRRRYAVVGWLWFVGMLVPVIGIVQVGGQGMADRYAYQPLIGIFLAVTWGGAEAYAALRVRAPRVAALSLFLPVLVVATWLGAARVQTAHWRDSVALFEHGLSFQQRNPTIRYNLANELRKRGEHAAASAHYRIVLETTPTDARVLNNLGNALRDMGRNGEAVEQYRSALTHRPTYARAHNNLGAALRAMERDEEALVHYREAVRLAPGYGLAHANIANTLRDRGDLDGAIAHYRRALAAQPENESIRSRLAETLAEQARNTSSEQREESPSAASSGS